MLNVSSMTLLKPGDRVLLAVPMGLATLGSWEDAESLFRELYPKIRFDPIFADVPEPRVIFVYRDGDEPYEPGMPPKLADKLGLTG